MESREGIYHLNKTLIEHEEVDAAWYISSAEGGCWVVYESAAHMKRTKVG